MLASKDPDSPQGDYDYAALALEAEMPRLFGVAYRLLGSAADADDVLQDAYVRLVTARSQEPVRDLGAYMRTVVALLCVDRLVSARARREVYVGPWLPGPILTDGRTPAPALVAEHREPLAVGALLLLESLSPAERAVLVLHDGFDFSHAELAGLLKRSTEACRQLLHRARKRLAGQGAAGSDAPDPATQQRLTEAFVRACERGEVAELATLLATDATFTSDGGGQVVAALRPIHGADAITRFMVGLLQRAPADLTVAVVSVNYQAGVLVRMGGQITHVFSTRVMHGKIVAIYAVANPDKLGFVRRQEAVNDAHRY